MPAGGELLVCGQYTVTWNSVALGIMEGDQSVPTIEQTTAAAPVASTDKYGKTEIDSVYQGANWFAQFVCEEAGRAGVMAAWWPFGTFGLLGIIGRLFYNMSAPLVLTVVAGTPAVGSPNTLTSNKAILARGFNTKLLYGPDIRKVPIRQQLYLYDTTGGSVYGWVTTT